MAILRAKDIRNMNQKDIENKISELKFELVRGNVTANRVNAKTKEIKRTISRLITINNAKMKENKETGNNKVNKSEQEELNNK